jgi:hypothetical protein
MRGTQCHSANTPAGLGGFSPRPGCLHSPVTPAASLAFLGRSVAGCDPRQHPGMPIGPGDRDGRLHPARSGLRPRGNGSPGVVARSDIDAVPSRAGQGRGPVISHDSGHREVVEVVSHDPAAAPDESMQGARMSNPGRMTPEEQEQAHVLLTRALNDRNWRTARQALDDLMRKLLVVHRLLEAEERLVKRKPSAEPT